jgi:hypothetical protein
LRGSGGEKLQNSFAAIFASICGTELFMAKLQPFYLSLSSEAIYRKG